MKYTAYLCMKDIRKNIVFILILYIQITISLIIIGISATEIPQCIKLKSHLSKLEVNNVVAFESFYNNAEIKPQMSEEVSETLKYIYDDKRQAFSVMPSYNFSEYPNIPVVIVVGNFTSLYPIDPNYNDSKTHVLTGANIKEVTIGSTLSFGGESVDNVIVTGRMLKGSNYYNRNFEQPLDDSIVVLTSYSEIKKLFGEYFDEEMIQNTNFINSDTNVLNSFVKTINKTRIINVIPHLAKSLYYDNYKTSIMSSIFFLLFL